MPHIILYIPVLHKGYLNFLQKYPEADKVWVVGEDLLAEFDQMRKDIRRLDPEQIKAALTAVGISAPVEVLSQAHLSELQTATELIMPDEDIMQALAERYFPDVKVTFDTAFLRWDRNKSLADQEIEAHEVISQAEFDQRMIAETQLLADKSSDWWRQVGGVVVKEGNVVLEAFNHHVPHEHMPHFDGDPRGNFHRGGHIDKSTAIHAEASLIAQATKQGISLSGASLYVTTFPCPNCAKLVAYSGIKKLYFQSGYAMVDGQSILVDQGVEIIRVTE